MDVIGGTTATLFPCNATNRKERPQVTRIYPRVTQSNRASIQLFLKTL